MSKRSVMLRMALMLIIAQSSALAAPPAVSHGAVDATPSPDQTRVADWRADLSELPDLLVRLHPHPFAKCPRQAFEQRVQALVERLPALTEDDRIVQTISLLASLGDTHTTLEYPPHFQPLPLGVYWFEEGLYVLKVARPYQRALGCRLVRVEDMPVKDVIAKLSGLVARDNEAMLLKSAPFLLALPPVLRSHGLLNRPGSSCRYTFVDAAGAEFTLEIEANQADFVSVAKPGPVPEIGKSSDPYWMACPAGALYVNLRQCRENPALPFATFFRQAAELGNRRGVSRVIVDLRENGGGNASMLMPLIRGLRRRSTLRQEGSLVVLIGRRTFSSGMLAAIDLKQTANALLIGEPTSGRPNHFGQVSETELPRTRMRLSHSTKLIRTVEGDPPSLVPDKLVAPRAADYFQGVDGALQAALRLP